MRPRGLGSLVCRRCDELLEHSFTALIHLTLRSNLFFRQPSTMDGKSIVPLLFDADTPGLPAQTKTHVKALTPTGQKAFAAKWRDSVST